MKAGFFFLFFQLINNDFEKNRWKFKKKKVFYVMIGHVPSYSAYSCRDGIVLGLLGNNKNIPNMQKFGQNWFNFTK